MVWTASAVSFAVSRVCVVLTCLTFLKCQNMHICTIFKGTHKYFPFLSITPDIRSVTLHAGYMFVSVCLVFMDSQTSTHTHTPLQLVQPHAGKVRVRLKCFSCSCSPGSQSELLHNMFFTPGSEVWCSTTWCVLMQSDCLMFVSHFKMASSPHPAPRLKVVTTSDLWGTQPVVGVIVY